MTTADVLRDLSERLDRADKQVTDMSRQAYDVDDVLKGLKLNGEAKGLRLAKSIVDEALREETS